MWLYEGPGASTSSGRLVGWVNIHLRGRASGGKGKSYFVTETIVSRTTRMEAAFLKDKYAEMALFMLRSFFLFGRRAWY